MYKRYIDPTIDFGFKHLFGDKRVLIAFLNALLFVGRGAEEAGVEVAGGGEGGHGDADVLEVHGGGYEKGSALVD